MTRGVREEEVRKRMTTGASVMTIGEDHVKEEAREEEEEEYNSSPSLSIRVLAI